MIPTGRRRPWIAPFTVPMELIALAGAVGARLDEVKAFTNPQLFSDLQAAAILTASAARAAATSATVNLAALTDRKEAERFGESVGCSACPG